MATDTSTQWEALSREFKAMLSSRSSNSRFRLLNLARNETPVAYLVSRKLAESQIVLPVGPGVTLIGRAGIANYVAERSLLAGIIEGAQWRISWTPEGVSIGDAGSTNGSVLVPRAVREEVDHELRALQNDPRAVRLGWDGSQPNDATQLIADGDVLVNIYAEFLFCRSDDLS